ncbi:MAG: FixH family protein, partial [Deltaproteobacteria bacterium]|nr:FixH family protein [Deltaproteobacteria bacterium]
RDDWYKDGKAINRRLEKEERAEKLRLLARVLVDDVTGEVSVALSGESIGDLQRLELELSHPTLSRLDQKIALERRELTGLFRGELRAAARGRWYAILTPGEAGEEGSPDGSWQLTRSVQLPSSDAIVFGSGLGSGLGDGS